eukprot:TRINITY_DN1101_c0_g1_i7.p1 TRINITY_DN1101_c0_g1~~TRINITY_DN1101_c0_g1_i7.p1  ORF type:complete len:103 (-),score=26.26 TRINITY_DN1101_c0_g1_i7:71-379(-)
MIRRPPRSTLSSSSAASDVYKRQYQRRVRGLCTLLECIARRGIKDEYRRCRRCSSRHTAIDLSLIHISEPTRLLSISYAVFCLKKKKKKIIKKQVDQYSYEI